MKKVFGWILVIVGGFNCLIHAICTPIVLTAEGQDWVQRLITTAVMVLFGVFWWFVCRWGFKLKKENKAAVAPAPKPATSQPPVQPPVAPPTVGDTEYLDDVTFIKSMHHTSPGGTIWQQYDVVLDARGYGWDAMKDWADYMAEADLEHISEVMVGTLGAEKRNLTESYASHGGKCKQTPELETEQGYLSIAGNSRTLMAPMKIVWINQTNTLRFFTLERKDFLMMKYVETVVRRTFGTADAMKLGKPLHEAKKPAPAPKPVRKNAKGAPAEFEGTNIYVDSKALMKWLSDAPAGASQYELQGVMPLQEKEPVITLYEDGEKTREYRLQTEGEEDFTGKYFLIGIRMHLAGALMLPVAQIDGFVSDTPEERKMTAKDIGYRMEGHFLKCGGENAALSYKATRGQDLVQKGLKYPGYTTPTNVRLVGICPECGKSFCFHGYAVYLGQCDAAYSDDGLDCCSVSNPNIDKNSWAYEADGKTFRYYNSFSCPHCGTPYIDYKRFPENKAYGVSGCVHLGRKLYACNE